MKPYHKLNSNVENESVIEKLFNQPNGFVTEIAERRARDLEWLMQALETKPELAFSNGACHIYAVCLTNADSRFIIHALSRPGRQDGRHVYCKLGGWAIDVYGAQSESKFIAQWNQKLSENLHSFEVSVTELMQLAKDGETSKNVLGHLLHEPFVRLAIDKAEIHIAKHLPGWRSLIDSNPLGPI